MMYEVELACLFSSVSETMHELNGTNYLLRTVKPNSKLKYSNIFVGIDSFAISNSFQWRIIIYYS